MLRAEKFAFFRSEAREIWFGDRSTTPDTARRSG
jgi:hypothetical protein